MTDGIMAVSRRLTTLANNSLEHDFCRKNAVRRRVLVIRSSTPLTLNAILGGENFWEVEEKPI